MTNHDEEPLKTFDAHDYDTEVPAVWERVQATHTNKAVAPGSRTKTFRPKFAAALLLACVAAAPAYGLWRDSQPQPLRLATGEPLPAAFEAANGATVVELSDGSILRLSAGSHVRVLMNDAEHVELLQRSGVVDYRVERRGRLWRVDAGLASVEVVGTRFTITRAGEVHVRVDEGRVLVRSTLFEDGVELLTAGTGVHLPSLVRGERPAASSPHVTSTDALLPPPGRLTHVGASSEELLSRASELGRTGQSQEAAVLFHLVVERNDAASAEAAYLLGSLHQSSRPELATHDFAVAIRLGLREPLRREAFRRRIEAAAAAGLPTTTLEESLLVAYPDEPTLP